MENKLSWFWTMVLAIGLVAAIALSIIALACCMSHVGDTSDARYVVADWVWVLLQFCVAGAFGGCLAVLRLFTIEEMYKSPDWTWTWARFYNFLVALGISAAGGIGGAIAALYLLVLNDKMKTISLEDGEVVRNVTMGVIAGYLGFTLLRTAGDSLNKILGQKVKDLEDQKKKTDQKLERQNLEIACNRGYSANKDSTPTSQIFQDALKKLEEARAKFPEDRMAAIILANMYFKKEEYEKSISVVDVTIRAIEANAAGKTPEERVLADQDIGDLLFNKACYLAKLWARSPAADKPRKKGEMLAVLRECFRRTPNNATEALHDPDFSDFATGQPPDAEFMGLTQEFRH